MHSLKEKNNPKKIEQHFTEIFRGLTDETMKKSPDIEAWFWQPTIHYLNQCRPSSSHGVTELQCINCSNGTMGSVTDIILGGNFKGKPEPRRKHGGGMDAVVLIYQETWPASDLMQPARMKQTYLTHWGRDKMDAISQTPFSSAFSWMKMFEFRLRFHWNLFLRVQLAIFQHWFR